MKTVTVVLIIMKLVLVVNFIEVMIIKLLNIVTSMRIYFIFQKAANI